VTLHYLDALTQAETAMVLGIETGTVKARLHKARVNLRRQLEPQMPSAVVQQRSQHG
jgi:DNA-directed RNA polymerase specialized sigma24 family protein